MNIPGSTQEVIISKGSLKCSGSTAFLKNNLGDGYHLTMSVSESADVEDISSFVQVKIIDTPFNSRHHQLSTI